MAATLGTLGIVQRAKKKVRTKNGKRKYSHVG